MPDLTFLNSDHITGGGGDSSPSRTKIEEINAGVDKLIKFFFIPLKMPEHVEYPLCGHFPAAGGGFVRRRPPSGPGQRTLTSDTGAFTERADGRMKTRAATRTGSAPNTSNSALAQRWKTNTTTSITILCFEILTGLKGFCHFNCLH